jgi:hypothetical protein
MKNSTKNTLLKSVLLLTAVCASFAAFAQPGGPPPPGGAIPIDGGAIALLVAGTVYGAKKLYKKGPKKEEE